MSTAIDQDVTEDTAEPTVNDVRFARQNKFLDQKRVRAAAVLVVGVGSVGRNVALQLAALGVGKIILCDFDTVDATNISTQGYLTDDLGKLKVDVVAESIKRIDPTIEVVAYREKYDPANEELNDVDAVFACPDKFSVRREIFEARRKRWGIIIDGRQTLEVSQTLTWVPGQEKKYESYLFDDKEAWGTACSQQGLIYTGMITAGFMLHQLARWLTDRETEPGTMLTLPAALLAPLDA